MTLEIAAVLLISVVAVILFVAERIRPDAVAAAIPAVLLVTGLIDFDTAVSGLSNPATVTVAAMLVLGMALEKTGVVRRLSGAISALPIPGRLSFIVLLLAVAILSAFVSNTAVVVTFVPVVMALGHRTNQPPSRLLIPLSFMAIIGGTVTLIGTSTNLIVQDLSRSLGYGDLTLFSIAPLGLVYLAIGFAYMLTIGRRLLPDRPPGNVLAQQAASREFTAELLLSEHSPAVGKLARDLEWEGSYGITSVHSAHSWLPWPPVDDRELREGDLLIVTGSADAIFRCAKSEGLRTPSSLVPKQPGNVGDDHIVEVMVSHDSRFAGRSLRELDFAQRHRAVAIALQRPRGLQGARPSDVPLRTGDLLLLQGSPESLSRLMRDSGFVPIGEKRDTHHGRARGYVSILILAGVVAAAALGITNIATAAVVGVIVTVATRCISIGEIYRDMDWTIITLLAGLMPLGLALDTTGAARLIGTVLSHVLSSAPAPVVVGAFYLFTSLITEMMSNQATAVVLTPIAISTATAAGMNPYTLIIAIMFGASASFMTPMGYQTNALIYGPGGYRVADYVRVGAPLNLLLACTAAFLIPAIWS